MVKGVYIYIYIYIQNFKAVDVAREKEKGKKEEKEEKGTGTKEKEEKEKKEEEEYIKKQLAALNKNLRVALDWENLPLAQEKLACIEIADIDPQILIKTIKEKNLCFLRNLLEKGVTFKSLEPSRPESQLLDEIKVTLKNLQKKLATNTEFAVTNALKKFITVILQKSLLPPSVKVALEQLFQSVKHGGKVAEVTVALNELQKSLATSKTDVAVTIALKLLRDCVKVLDHLQQFLTRKTADTVTVALRQLRESLDRGTESAVDSSLDFAVDLLNMSLLGYTEAAVDTLKKDLESCKKPEINSYVDGTVTDLLRDLTDGAKTVVLVARQKLNKVYTTNFDVTKPFTITSITLLLYRQ